MADAPAAIRIGRFAPSPTGPLHFGSLVAATASYLSAKTPDANVGAAPLRRDGLWLLRIEDLDPPREVPGAADAILRDLERFGFEWDGEVTYQSRRHDLYASALARLIADGHAYPCGCSRKEIADHGLAGIEGAVYPGTCRHGLPDGKQARAWRVRTHDEPIAFDDRLRGTTSQRLESQVGDFVVKRADGNWAYQLAVVVDDADQGVTEVVRGADLIDSTTRQIHLQRLLGLNTPDYAHVPVVLDEHGHKLSKSTGAIPLGDGHEAAALWHALAFLQQDPPEDLRHADTPAPLWAWAFGHARY